MSEYSPSHQPVPPSSPEPTSLTPSSSRRPWLVWVLGGIALLMLLCVIGAIVGGIRLFQGSQREADAGLQVIDQFMRAGAHNDPDAGIGLFAPAVDGSIPTRADIAQVFTTRSDLFRGYQLATQDTYNLTTGTSGTILTLQGKLHYASQTTKPFVAELHKVASVWKLVSMRFPEGVGG